MLCGNCGKREVEVLVKQVVGDEVQDIHLCRRCAEELGFLSSQLPSIMISFSLHDAEVPQPKKIIRLQSKRDEEKSDGITCPSCGMAYKEFRKGGLLGCPECYQAFRFPLGARLQRVQGAESHWGGTAKMFSDIAVLDEEAHMEEQNLQYSREEKDASIRRLNEEIKDAVLREEYERAAKLRDLLNPLLEDDEATC